ncbi:MAG: helix-turn-helix domain-containing protein [Bacteroidota bacterium]
MTDKKEKILLAALELFANEGYNATPTSRIAKLAEVSEGLIFKHFRNKKGLLDAIVGEAEVRMQQFFLPVFEEDDPKEVLKKVIEMPFHAHVSLSRSQKDFWKLQFKLKWEKEYHKPEKMQPLIDKLTVAFTDLSYANPEQEAKLLTQIIDTISVEMLRDSADSQLDYHQFLLHKYNL